MNTLQAATSIPGQLTQTLLSGGQANVDQAMKMAAVGVEMKVAAQQQSTVMAAVSQMTGVGTQVDTVV